MKWNERKTKYIAWKNIIEEKWHFSFLKNNNSIDSMSNRFECMRLEDYSLESTAHVVKMKLRYN